MGKINEICEVEIIYKRPSLTSMEQIQTSKDIADLFRKMISTERMDFKEFFLVALLSRSNHILGVSEISVGTANQTTINIKEILQLAIKSNSSALIICHNHPSGNLSVSESDLSVTRKIKDACHLFDIDLLDHIVLTSEGYYSVADNLGI